MSKSSNKGFSIKIEELFTLYKESKLTKILYIKIEKDWVKILHMRETESSSVISPQPCISITAGFLDIELKYFLGMLVDYREVDK